MYEMEKIMKVMQQQIKLVNEMQGEMHEMRQHSPMMQDQMDEVEQKIVFIA